MRAIYPDKTRSDQDEAYLGSEVGWRRDNQEMRLGLGAVVMRTKKPTNVVAKKRTRNFRAVVGADTYAVWVRMLRELVPDGRTHRLPSCWPACCTMPVH